MTAAMRAVVQRAFGGPEVLETAEVDRPGPVMNEVLVRVHAAGVNQIDALVRSGTLPLLGPPPFTLGWDLSGVVVETAPGVTRFAVGDEVFGMPCLPRAAAAYAEYAVAPSRQLVRKPASLDHREAAGLPLVGLTAWQALVDTARVTAGDRVLVHAAGGGVGHLAVQLAKARGAEVIATASAGKADFVRGIGADQVIDYRARDFTEEAGDVDVVLDTLGGDLAVRSLDVLRPGGLLVTVVDIGDETLVRRAGERGLRCLAVTCEPDQVGLAALVELVEAGRLRPHVGQVLPLESAAEAHTLLASAAFTGKIVLTPDGR
ncbi:NADPH:quinone reductase [Streptomyces fumigatiscleroticus]|nr:NADPH:quinone reductase [Streptomyces fumigatiscleroticus]